MPLVAATSSHAFVLTVSHGFYSPLPSCSDRSRRLTEKSALRAPRDNSRSLLAMAQGKSLRPSIIEPPILAALVAISPHPRSYRVVPPFINAPRRVQERRLALPDEVSRPAFSEPSALITEVRMSFRPPRHLPRRAMLRAIWGAPILGRFRA